MPSFWACFASAAMASSLACVLAAPPLRASSIAASHFAQLADRRLDMAAEDAQHDLGVLVSLGDVAVVPGLREGGHGGLLLRLEPFGALLGGDVHSLLDACPVLACRFAGVLERQVWKRPSTFSRATPPKR